MYISSILLFFASTALKKDNQDYKVLTVFLFVTAWIGVCCIYSGLSYQTIVSAILFLTMLSIGFVYRKIDISRAKSIILLTHILIAISLVYFSGSPTAYEFTVNMGDYVGQKYIGDNLTFGFNNSNESGMYLYFVITILISLSFSLRGKNKYLLYSLICYLIYFLVLTNCRTSLVTLVLVVLSFLLDRKKHRISKSSLCTLGIILTPFLFSLIYIYLSIRYENQDITILGKPLFSGRESSFLNFYNIIGTSWFFGNIGHFHFANMLNAYITIFANIGLWGLIAYLYYQKSLLNKLACTQFNDMQYFAYIAILGSFINSSAESVFFVMGGRWFVFLLTLFVLSSQRFKDNDSSISMKSLEIRK